MASRLPLIHLLEDFCQRNDKVRPPRLDAGIVDWMIRTGCGPMAWSAWREHLRDDAVAHKLQAADLTARVMHAGLTEHVGDLLSILSDESIAVAPLKGLSAAHRYYPEPHLRIMGDVDLLLQAEQIPAAIAVLEKAGFISHPELRKAGYETHHHVAPLHHSGWQLWLELHHGLLKPDFVAADDPPFCNPWLAELGQPGELNGHSVRWLSREFELAYIAAGFCLDLVEGFAHERVQRNLCDATLILNPREGRIDESLLLNWSVDSAIGACLLVLLSYLQHHELIAARELVRELAARQKFVDRTTINIFIRLLDRYVAQPRRPGWTASRSLPGATKNLLAPRAPWLNRAAAALCVLRPPA